MKNNFTMNKQLEEEAYRLCQSHCLVNEYGKAESDAMDAMLEFVKSDVAKSFHTKEATELIKELRKGVKECYYKMTMVESVQSLAIEGTFDKEIDVTKQLITKAEKFLNK